MNEPEKRRASRLILIANKTTLLLRHQRQSGETFWAPPGGGVEEGETFEKAAVREASEELGLDGVILTLLWEQTADFIYIDRPVHQQEQFFRLAGDFGRLFSNVKDIHAREHISETKWWSLDELESTKEPIFPSDLAARLRTLLI